MYDVGDGFLLTLAAIAFFLATSEDFYGDSAVSR